MNKNWLLCRCGKRFSSVAEHRDHRNAGECPYNAPDSSSPGFLTWATTVRALTAAERVKKEKQAAHLEEVKSNPEYQENRQRRIEEKKSLKTAMKRFSTARGRG
jgi:hypothetical protein